MDEGKVENTSPWNDRGVKAESKLDELNGLIAQLLKVMKARSGDRSPGNRYGSSPERGPRRCWTCGGQGHQKKLAW